jgi:hypothetical protein
MISARPRYKTNDIKRTLLLEFCTIKLVGLTGHEELSVALGYYVPIESWR